MSKSTTRKNRIIAATAAAAVVVVPSVFGLGAPASAVVSTLPTISKLSVVSGSTGGATNVLITGSNFNSVVTGTPANVMFGAVSASSSSFCPTHRSPPSRPPVTMAEPSR